MYKKQLEDLITKTLKGIGKYSPEAVRLLLGTAAQESKFGYYIRQLNNGCALGIFQMEPATFKDICNRYLFYKYYLLIKILDECEISYPERSGYKTKDLYVKKLLSLLRPEYLEWNLKVAICFARVHYLRRPEALPFSVEEMAKLWKNAYNTILGSGTEEEFIENYKKYVK